MELHDYQKYAVRFIEEHPIAALFLDMGLGKTITTLTAIHNLMFDLFAVRKVLVIAPLRVARDTWSAEIEKWEHLKPLRYSVAVGTEEERLAALKADADIYIINRENLDWLVNNTKFDYDMVVIDELSSFKSHQSKRFKALMKVRPNVKRIVGLTGTPASNGLMDLWAEFRLLDMGQRLGRFIGQYRNEYFKPDKQNGYIVYSYKPLPDAERQIYEKIADITVSMKAIDHLHMPELLSNEYPVQLSDMEQETYKRFKSELILEMQDTEITAANAASLSNKLSQLANGAVYDDTGAMTPIHSRKQDALGDLIEAANGKTVLVAYWFKHDLERIQERLRKLNVSYQEIQSSDSIRNWNAGRLQAVRTLQEPLAALPEASKTLSDLAADITAEVQAYAALQRQLQTLIDSLPVPEYRTLLELRYLSGSKWEEIAEAMSMHVRWVYRMHGRALQAAQKILDTAK